MLETLILLLLQAAPRRDENLHFMWKDLNRDTLTLKVSKKPNWSPKHGKERFLKLSYKLANLINTLPRKGDYIFTQVKGRREGHPFSTSQLERFVVDGFIKKLGIKGYLHKFRDNYASYSLACGVDTPKVQSRMGHKSLKETDKYVTAINEKIDTDVRLLFEGERGELKE